VIVSSGRGQVSSGMPVDNVAAPRHSASLKLKAQYCALHYSVLGTFVEMRWDANNVSSRPVISTHLFPVVAGDGDAPGRSTYEVGQRAGKK
jgi:hypothetical protein